MTPIDNLRALVAGIERLLDAARRTSIQGLNGDAIGYVIEPDDLTELHRELTQARAVLSAQG